MLSGTNQIFIGASNKTTNISGTAINIGNTGLSATGRVNIASGANVAGSEMFLGSTTLSYNNIRANIIHIADTGLSATGKVHIASGINGANVAGSEVNIGSTSLSAVNIKGGQTNLETTTLNLNTNGTGNTLIGTSGGSNSITLNRPLTVGYAPADITTLTQIGRTVETAIGPITGISNTGQSLVTLTIGTAGVYIINFSFRYSGATTAVANCESWFQTSTGGNIQYGNQAYYSNPNALMGSNVICQAGSAVITATSTSTITFYCFITYTGGAPQLDGNFCYYSYTRLA